MASFRDRARRWLRRLLNAQTGAPPRPASAHGFARALTTGARAAAGIESASCAACEQGLEALPVLIGNALGGERAALFAECVELPSMAASLRTASRRRLPIVVHVDAGEELAHAASAGWVILRSYSVQQSIDMTFLAHRIAERTLTPVLLAHDRLDAFEAVEEVEVPTVETIDVLLGRAADEIPAPDDAQRLLLGDTRRRVPIWMDVDRPFALVRGVGADGASAGLVSQRLYFSDAILALVEEEMRLLGEQIGRELTTVTRRAGSEAEHVVVTSGATPGADLLVNLMRPFPAAELAAAVAGAKTVIVVEDLVHDLDGTAPLCREVRAALAAHGGAARARSVLLPPGGRLGSTDALLLRATVATEPAGPDGVVLGVSPAAKVLTAFPRREARLGELARVPTGRLLQAPQRLTAETPEAPGTRALLAVVTNSPSRLVEVCDVMAEGGAKRHVQARWVHTEPRMSVGLIGEAHAGDLHEARAAAALVETLERDPGPDPLTARLTEGAIVVVVSGAPADTLGLQMPAAWRRHGLRVYRHAGDADELPSLMSSLADGQVPANVDKVEPRHEPPSAPSPRLPAQDGMPDLVRFHGESLQPALAGEQLHATADPRLAVAALPPLSAAFHAPPPRAVLPVIDATLCTGCGKCWSACPDAALAPVAVSSRALLESAADRAAAPDKLRRALRNLAVKLDGKLIADDVTVLDAAMLREGFDWLLEQMGLADEELEQAREAASSITEIACDLPATATDIFFSIPHRAARGTGELLALAVDADACSGCGACAPVCEAEAIDLSPRTAELVTRARSGMAAYATLPDTAGATIERMGDAEPGVDAVAAALLSRHCLTSMASGDAGVPDQDVRLALRQVVALLEAHQQPRALGLAARLEETATRARAKIRELMAGALPVDDLESLERETRGGRHDDLAALTSRLAAAGQHGAVDGARLRALAHCAGELEDARDRILRGDAGLGRSRCAIVMAPGALESETLFNPFQSPVALDLDGSETALGIGVASALERKVIEPMRLLRVADVYLRWPPDHTQQLAALLRLTPEDLDEVERRSMPPLLVIVRGARAALSGLAGWLGSNTPVKIIMLDDGDPELAAIGRGLVELARVDAHVVSTSTSEPDHLAAGLDAAIDHPGPAFIRLLAQDVVTARETVAAGYPLLSMAPGAENLGNLLERQQTISELEAAHAAALAAVESEHLSQLEALRASRMTEMRELLEQRLARLAGLDQKFRPR